ncbi:MAG: hypothetical protein ACO3EO_01475 [Candidatus Kapaibacteriota bacterium]
MIIQDDLSALVQDICDHYSHAELSMAYNEYLRGQVLINANHPALQQFIELAKQSEIPEKIEIALLYATIVTDDELANALLSYLHEPVYAIIESVVWRGSCHAVQSSKNNDEISTIQYSEDSVLPSLAIAKPEYSLLALDELTPPLLRRVQTSKVLKFQNVWFTLPPLLKQALRNVMKSPISLTPKISAELPKAPKTGWNVFESEHRLPEIIKDLIPRVKSDFYIEECGSPNSLQRKKTKSLISMYSIPELYPDQREYDTIQTAGLIWLLLNSSDSQTSTKTGIDITRSCYELLVKNAIPVKEYLLHFLVDNQTKNNMSSICAGIPHLLEFFPKQGWVDIESLIDTLIVHELLPPLYPELPAKEDAAYLNLSTYDKPAVDPLSYREAIYPTLIRGILGLLGSLGMLDFLAHKPVNHHYQLKGFTFLSPWDGLAYARITELGLIFLGKQEEVSITQFQPEEDPYFLDSERLMITVRGIAAHRQLALTQFARRISGQFFQVDSTVFTKGCHTVKDIQQRILQFKTIIRQDLPDNWEQFFQDLIDKANALIPEPASLVFKLKDQSELAQLFATDPELKLISKRAEGFRIIVNRTDLAKLKQRLSELGYFID